MGDCLLPALHIAQSGFTTPQKSGPVLTHNRLHNTTRTADKIVMQLSSLSMEMDMRVFRGIEMAI